MITVKDCLTRYARRQLIAIVIFGTMYSAMIIASSGTINIMIIPKAIWGGITGNTFSHLWYCFMLIGVYLILPVLKSFIDKAEDKDLEYLLFVLFVFDFIIPCINLLLDRDIQFNIPFTYVLFYVICGYYIGKKEVKSIIYGIASVVSIICIGILAYMNPVINLKYLDYDSPIVALLAIGIFGMAKCVCTKKKIIENTKIKTTTWEIDRLCFGVYLMHPLFIQVFYRIIGITPIRFKIYQIGTVITFIVVVILAFVFSWIMRKIPFMKNYVL
jgi:surface polysaccharide O-acyltransferase-like enzyme